MARFCLIAVVVCPLLLIPQSKRINRGTAHGVQSFGHSRDTDVIVAYDENLVACEDSDLESKERFIIQGKDKAFVDYHYACGDFFFDESEEVHEPVTVKCKNFTASLKPTSMLKSLTNPTLPEDVTGLIGSFIHDVHCSSCFMQSFNMSLLQKCSAARSQNQWASINREVNVEGGSCYPNWLSINETTLQTCMTSAKANQVAVCYLESDSYYTEVFLKEHAMKIQEHEDIMQETQDLLETKHREYQKFIEEAQQLIHGTQENIKHLQDDFEMHKQNNVYLKQIFESP